MSLESASFYINIQMHLEFVLDATLVCLHCSTTWEWDSLVDWDMHPFWGKCVLHRGTPGFDPCLTCAQHCTLSSNHVGTPGLLSGPLDEDKEQDLTNVLLAAQERESWAVVNWTRVGEVSQPAVAKFIDSPHCITVMMAHFSQMRILGKVDGKVLHACWYCITIDKHCNTTYTSWDS